MKQLLLTVLAVMFVATLKAQITSLEYFTGSDPGYGQAILLSASAGADISRDFTLALSSFSRGFHTVSFRAKNAQGSWSHTYSHIFYVTSADLAQVTDIEYFIDSDPGTGNATHISIPPGIITELNQVIPLSSVSSGLHLMGLRTKNSAEVWSHTQYHVFLVSPANTLSPVQKLEYYFTGTGTDGQVYSYVVPTPTLTVDFDFTANLSSLVGDREYDIHITAIDSIGVRSQEVVKKVKVCNGAVANAAFDFVTLGSEIFFIDNSTGASKYKWDFGDGTNDSVSNPVHTYSTGGNYQVQMIASNFCNSDTIIRQVNVVSLQSIYPNKGGNNGTVTVQITGAGFTDSTEVRLVKNATVINATNKISSNSGKVLSATFDLHSQEIGNWSVIAQHGSNSDTLTQVFTIEAGITPFISIEIEGRDVVRGGMFQKYGLIFKNTGNVNATGVPVWFAVSKNTEVKFNFDLIVPKSDNTINFDTVEIFQSLDSLFGIADSVDIYGFFLKSIPVNGSISLDMEMKFAIGANRKIYAWANKPFYGSPLKVLVGECLDGIIEEVSAFIPPVGCAYAITDLYLTPITAIDNLHSYNEIVAKFEKHKFSNQPINSALFKLIAGGKTILPLFMPLVKIVEDCSGLGSGLRILEQTKKVYSKWGNWLDAFESGSVAGECAVKLFGYETIRQKIIQVVTSIDPNEKVGPQGNSVSNYKQGSAPFDYKIYFENKSTATAPAQEVIIVDTLDKTKFDLSSFQLKSFGFGDSTNTLIPAGFQFYATNVRLQRTGKPNLLVRVDAKLDTVTGILRWRFLSIDPITRELTDDPLDGFLPPNVTSPQGEGFVSYSIQPKPNLVHGTVIKNMAAIYFDSNAPIITNEYVNTIDKLAPVSSVFSLPIYSDSVFAVSWAGTDGGAGIRSYDVYYSQNGSPFSLWQYDVSSTSALFTGKIDSSYRFYSIAKDYAGNIETSKSATEASTTVQLYQADSICVGNSIVLSSGFGGNYLVYQWQIDTGQGFVNIDNSATYSNVSSPVLTITTPPSKLAGAKYRCVASKNSLVDISLVRELYFFNYWTGSISDIWEEPSNWSCNVVPDRYTDVVINEQGVNAPMVRSMANCRSLNAKTGTAITVATGFALDVHGKEPK